MKKYFQFLAVSAIMLAPCVALAQPANPVAPVPIDGGISLLIAAGAAFGAKKLYDRKSR